MIFPPIIENIEKIANHLVAGGIAAFATETVYGLGANAADDKAVAAIYSYKNRPNFNPLIAHYANIEELAKDVEMNEIAWHLAQYFWPGGLTLVLPKTPNSRIGKLATAGLKTAAVRIPAHSVALDLLSKVAMPIVAPSANPSGRLSPVTAKMVAELFADESLFILDGGEARLGLESTVVDLTKAQPVLLRPGAIAVEDINEVLPTTIKMHNHDNNDTVLKSPGMALAHYAPRCSLQLLETDSIPQFSSEAEPRKRSNKALLTFANMHIPEGFRYVLNLSPSGDLAEAACNLFNYLYRLEKMKVDSISAYLLPEEGLGRAINDRLRRACQASSGFTNCS
jgi:L-threonylcarbamoyladenylate synthase